jgi:ribose 1,5-bisphosphokinase
MAEGMDVVVNGSRQHMPCARERYPDVQAILIEADPDVIRARLAARGRETDTEIERRLLRKPDPILDAYGIRNDGRLEEAGDALLATLITYHQSSRT